MDKNTERKYSQTLKCCQLHVVWNSCLVLFLTRGGLPIFCVVILVIGGVLSQHILSLSHYENSTDYHVISTTLLLALKIIVLSLLYLQTSIFIISLDGIIFITKVNPVSAI